VGVDGPGLVLRARTPDLVQQGPSCLDPPTPLMQRQEEPHFERCQEYFITVNPGPVCAPSLFHGKLGKRGSPAWEGLVSAVADLRAQELLEEVREAFANDSVDPMFAWFEEIERDILGPPRPLRGYDVIADAVSLMQGWYFFNRQESATSKPPLSPATFISATASSNNAAPIHREKIGRNRPCPCGSGKKYKKCCGSN